MTIKIDPDDYPSGGSVSSPGLRMEKEGQVHEASSIGDFPGQLRFEQNLALAQSPADLRKRLATDKSVNEFLRQYGYDADGNPVLKGSTVAPKTRKEKLYLALIIAGLTVGAGLGFRKFFKWGNKTADLSRFGVKDMKAFEQITGKTWTTADTQTTKLQQEISHRISQYELGLKKINKQPFLSKEGYTIKPTSLPELPSLPFKAGKKKPLDQRYFERIKQGLKEDWNNKAQMPFKF